MNRLATVSDVLNRQLEQHGYHLTDTELADVAAQVVMVTDEHPIARIMSARLAALDAGIDSSSFWLYGNRTPETEAVIRQWAADHTDVCNLDERNGVIRVGHLKSFDVIVTWYPRFEEPAQAPRVETDRDQMWSPTSEVRQ